MFVSQSVRGEDQGEPKPRNKRKYDKTGHDKRRREIQDGGRTFNRLPKRASGDDEDDEVGDDYDLDEDEDFDLDEDDDFDLDDDDDDDDWDDEDDDD